MTKIILIDDLLLFKIVQRQSKSMQYLCICSTQYKDELNMEVGDIIFIKTKKNSKFYERLGEIRGFNERKVIVGFMSDIGKVTKSQIDLFDT